MPDLKTPVVQLRLRPTLVSAIVGLVLLTALVLGASAGLLMLNNTRALIDQARIGAVDAATDEVRDLFELAPRITSELAAQAERGALPLDQPEKLVAMFAERLRANPELAWIGYGDLSTGRYIGATRWRFDSDEVVEYVADPQIANAMPSQFAVARDGSRSTPSYVEDKPYLVTTKDWFKLGMGTPGPVWSAFYQFTSGGLGITGMTRFTAAGQSAPSGLFHVDLRLESIAKFLSGVRIGPRGAVFLIDRDGRRIVSPTGDHVAAAAAAVDAAPRGRQAIGGAPVRVDAGGRSYEVVFAQDDVSSKAGLAVAVVVDLADVIDGIHRQAIIAAAAGLAAALMAILLGVILSSRIARPVAAIAGDLAAVGDFKISTRPSQQSFIREISDLGHSVDKMKASLRSFGHYVPTDLVRTLLTAGREAELGGEMRRLTIQFSDVADFTSIAEQMDPNRLVDTTGRYFEIMTGAITRHEGTVDKFMGDGILAFFNAPLNVADHPRKACLSALEAQRRLAVLAQEAYAKGEPVFRARIGLSIGDVVVGNIGTPERFAYTVIGDAVNLASRLEALNKIFGTAILATDYVMLATGRAFEWRRIDRVAVKGRQEGTLVCELLGESGMVPAEILAARDVYERALHFYFLAKFRDAADLFQEAAAARPDDRAPRVMLERCRQLMAEPPAHWDGVHVMRAG